jgi:hypothetical protein
MDWQASDDLVVREQWRSPVSCWEDSGEELTKYARERRFSVAAFRHWVSWFEGRQSGKPSLVEVTITDLAITEVSGGVSSVSQPDVSQSDIDQTMIVELLNGRCVHISPGFEPSSLAQLVAVLERS